MSLRSNGSSGTVTAVTVLSAHSHYVAITIYNYNALYAQIYRFFKRKLYEKSRALNSYLLASQHISVVLRPYPFHYWKTKRNISCHSI